MGNGLNFKELKMETRTYGCEMNIFCNQLEEFEKFIQEADPREIRNFCIDNLKEQEHEDE
jgi:hypothetical protein